MIASLLILFILLILINYINNCRYDTIINYFEYEFLSEKEFYLLNFPIVGAIILNVILVIENRAQ